MPGAGQVHLGRTVYKFMVVFTEQEAVLKTNKNCFWIRKTATSPDIATAKADLWV